MKNFKKFAILGFSTFIMLFLACSSEDGETGPQGPQGEQGIQGEPGANGNANIIASEWLNITFSPILGNTISATLIDNRITTELIENSVFLLYGRSNATTPQSLISIPLTEPNLGVSLYYVLDASRNQIEILGVYFAGATPIPNIIDQVRFVIIPANMGSTSLENLDYEDIISQLEWN
ncbi:collagen-like triple helix repeat-containing protein [Flagellimonas sp.]|uniref:collagen-like triple helix repeat-containing protein n=1 Tax=Flagellimonas sp. TaxID=2058762 RepID=UPI003F4A7C42